MIRTNSARVATAFLTLLLVACGGGDPAGGAPGAATVDEAPADFATLLANADVERGKMMYFQCRACHSLLEGAPNKVGPTLYGMFGSEAGFAPGFAYSEAMSGSGIVWTPETVDAWLANPSAYIPGNRMVFVGIKKPADRASLIAYLQSQTGP